MNPDKNYIGELLRSAGAVAFGVAEAKPVADTEWDSFLSWLEEGKNAGMDYMARYLDVRKNPQLLLDGAKSIISVAFSYVPEKIRDNSEGYISCYAYGKDYHKVLKKRLDKVVVELKGKFGGEYRICIDSAPILEKYWAQQAGIGFRGDNGSLIVPGYGSMVFLAEIVTTLSIDPDSPCSESCGSCGICHGICPGKAIDSTGTIDSNRCINYLTIEHKGEWEKKDAIATMSTPEGLNTIFGCDRCIVACPHNRNIPFTSIKEFSMSETVTSLSIDSVRNMSYDEFDKKITGTPIRRAGYEGLLRNVSDRT